MTKSQQVASDVSALLRARSQLLWIVTREEARAEAHLFEAAAAAGYVACSWDVAQGAATISGAPMAREGETEDLNDMLGFIRARITRGERNAWFLRDAPVWLQGMPGARPLRSLRNLVKMLPTVDAPSAQAVIIVSPSNDIPPELTGHVTVIEWPLPDREEIASLLDASIAVLPEFEKGKDGKPDPTRPLREAAAPNGQRDAAIDAAIGLSADEAHSCFAKSLVKLHRIDPATVAQEKRRVIAREKVLEWFDPLPGGLDAVGGLENLKAWLVSRGAAYTPAARAYGLPAPKGALLAGVPGCGKSLTAKAIATAWGVPLLKLDLGALKGKFVGESEGNLRRAIAVIEAIGRCVVWIDEIEKGFQGATGGAADGGVSADQLGAVLSWMQERQGEAFVIATANDAESLPPELYRKGRFDDVWFVDLPNATEREQILAASLVAHKRRNAISANLLGSIARASCDGFTGSEIAELVPSALFEAFADGARGIRADDLVNASDNVTPLAKTAAEKIEKLRKWAQGRARPASRPDNTQAPSEVRSRQLDL